MFSDLASYVLVLQGFILIVLVLYTLFLRNIKNELLCIREEMRDMRSEWDMECLKKNILNMSGGDSGKWSKWQKAFGGKE